RRADLRRLRLHQGIPRRETDARRQAAADLRGHFADPAHGDRPQPPRRPLSTTSARVGSMRLLSLALILACASVAWGHGGLPVAETIIFQGEKMVVPTQYWGAFYGENGVP